MKLKSPAAQPEVTGELPTVGQDPSTRAPLAFSLQPLAFRPFWSAATVRRFPTARHVSPIKAQTRPRTPKGFSVAKLCSCNLSTTRPPQHPIMPHFVAPALHQIAVDCGKLRQIAPGGSVPSVSPSAIRHPPSAIRHPPFAIFYLLSSILSAPNPQPFPRPRQSLSVAYGRVRSPTVAHGRLRSLFFFGFRVSFRPAVPICRAGVQRRRTWCFGFRKTRICA